jgi:hypothetical protein
MRNTRVAIKIIGIIILSFCAASIATAQENFSGIWVLDKVKTKGLPPGLQTYTMTVKQDEQQIVVGTKVEGSLAPSRGGGPLFDDGGAPGGRGGGGGGMRGGGGGGGAMRGGGGDLLGGGSPEGTVAIRMFIPQATYSLDGQKTTSELPGLGTVTAKAKWAKDKKRLELSLVRVTQFQGRPVTFSSDERWALSDEGEVLDVQRAADTPGATDSIKLVFHKLKGEAPTPSR